MENNEQKFIIVLSTDPYSAGRHAVSRPKYHGDERYERFVAWVWDDNCGYGFSEKEALAWLEDYANDNDITDYDKESYVLRDDWRYFEIEEMPEPEEDDEEA